MNAQQQRRQLTLAQYVRRRNGVPFGASGALRNMLRRSLGAGSFAEFWQYWNPVWGYGLGRYVYTPLKRILPPTLALLMTFSVSGALHDLAVTIVRGSTTFLFAPWFFALGAGVIVGRGAGMDFSNKPWPIRAGVNLAYLVACLAVTLIAKRFLTIP